MQGNSHTDSSSNSFIDITKGLITLAVVVGIIVIAIVLLFHLITPILVAIAQAFSEIDVAIMVAFITGMISIVSVVVGAIVKTKMDHSQQKQEFLTEKRIKPYEKLVAIVFKIQSRTNSGEEYSQDELLEDFSAFSESLTLWGSTKAIRKWNAWRITAKESPVNPKETLYAMEEVIIQLRMDLGQNKGIKKGELLHIFINDLDES